MSDRPKRLPPPDGWAIRLLGDIASRVTLRNSVNNRNVLTISARHGLVSQEEFFSKRVASADASQYFLLERGDFAYNKSYSSGLPVGVVRRLDLYERGIVSPLYICFRPKPKYVNSDYLQYCFQSGLLDDDIAWIAKEGARNHGLLNVGVDEFFSIRVQLPTLAEQEEIARILSKADRVIWHTERLIIKLQHLNNGLLRQLITCGVDETGYLRDLKPGEFVASVLGMIPSGWTVANLGELGTIRSGSTPPRSMSSRYFRKDGIPWVKTLDLNEGQIFDTDERVSAAALRETSCPLLAPGAVLVAMYGGWAQIGRTGLMAIAGSINQAVSAIELTGDTVIPQYLQIALQLGRSRWRATGASTRKDPNITRQDIQRFVIPVPPKCEQQRIVSVVGTLRARIISERENLRKLRAMKKALMDDLLNGHVRVRVRRVLLGE